MSRSPKLLNPETLRKLNQETFDSTGFFFFLRADSPVLRASQEGRDSFHALVATLYCVYADYSKGHIDKCFKDEFLPPDLKGDTAFIDKRDQAREHFKSVRRGLRQGLLHGHFPDTGTRRQLVESLRDLGLLARTGRKKDWQAILNEIGNIKKKEWIEARERLCDQSDLLYEYLDEWKNGWAQASPSLREGIYEQFFRADWIDENFLTDIIIGISAPGKAPRAPKALAAAHKTELAAAIRDKYLAREFSDPEQIYDELKKRAAFILEPPKTSSLEKSRESDFGFPK